MALCYDGDPNYPVEVYDEVVVVAGDVRFPGTIRKVLPRRAEVVVSFENVDPVLDLIMLRKAARVPLSAVELTGRSM